MGRQSTTTAEVEWFNKALGHRLRALREERGIDRQWVSDRLGRCLIELQQNEEEKERNLEEWYGKKETENGVIK